jgi:hypothetical protein
VSNNPEKPKQNQEQKQTPDKPDMKQTSHLNMPDIDPSKAMKPRQPRPNTTLLTDKWQIILTIGDKKEDLTFSEHLLVGRAIDNETHPTDVIGFDLTAFGAYHYGVSRHHAMMTLQEGYLYLEDLGSTNGTRINGFQLTANQKYRLRDGDEIEFARLRTHIRFKGPGAK